MITRTVFTKLIRAMEGIHDLDEVFETLLGRNPDNVPDSIIGRLQSGAGHEMLHNLKVELHYLQVAGA